jgi:translation initiation factor eIF-2B subunit gamma
LLCSAKIEGCILGRGTKVGAKAELVRCVTQAGYEIDGGGKKSSLFVLCMFTKFLYRTIETLKTERLEVSDWTAAASESDNVDSDESDE